MQDNTEWMSQWIQALVARADEVERRLDILEAQLPAVHGLRKVLEEERASRCPLRKKHGDVICIDGVLWGLTYSEMGPPDSRQNMGPCKHCKTEVSRRE